MIHLKYRLICMDEYKVKLSSCCSPDGRYTVFDGNLALIRLKNDNLDGFLMDYFLFICFFTLSRSAMSERNVRKRQEREILPGDGLPGNSLNAVKSK